MILSTEKRELGLPTPLIPYNRFDQQIKTIKKYSASRTYHFFCVNCDSIIQFIKTRE